MLSLGFPTWAYPVWVCCLVLLVWAGVRALRDQPVIFKQLIGAAVIEVFLLVQTVVAIVQAVRGHTLAEPATFWGYVVVVLLLLPAGAVVSIAERTRWSSVALVVLLVAVATMQMRMLSLWAMGTGA